MKIGDLVIFGSAIKKPTIAIILKILETNYIDPMNNYYSILLSDTGKIENTTQYYLYLITNESRRSSNSNHKNRKASSK